MTNEIAKTNSTDLIHFDDDKLALIKRTIAPTATDDELELFLHQCRRTGLDPLAKQIYFQKYNTKDGPKVSIITAIDGYRLVADRTGLYAGSDEPKFEGRKTQKRYNDSTEVPVKATATVYKIVGGKRVPFSASAYWDEYYPGDKPGHMWFKMPHVMLGKVAEAQALRKAFPADLSGVYTREEMDQAGWEDVKQVTADEPDPEPPTTEGEFVEFDDLEPASETPADKRGPTAPTEQAKHERPKPPNGDGPKPPMPTDAMKKAFHKLGTEIYGDGWDDKRPELVRAISAKRDDGSGPVVSSNDLYRAEMQSLIGGMEARKREADAA